MSLMFYYRGPSPPLGQRRAIIFYYILEVLFFSFWAQFVQKNIVGKVPNIRQIVINCKNKKDRQSEKKLSNFQKGGRNEYRSELNQIFSRQAIIRKFWIVHLKFVLYKLFQRGAELFLFLTKPNLKILPKQFKPKQILA